MQQSLSSSAFFGHTRKTSFLTSEKEDQVARIRGMGGGGELIWALPESGGGEALARICWPFFYHVIVPKIGKCLPKTLYICMFFGHFCHHYHQNYHHNYHCNRHYHHRHFFCHTRKTSFLTSEKEDQVARIGGREVIWVMPERKHSFF